MDQEIKKEMTMEQETEKKQEEQVQVFQEDKWDYDYDEKGGPLKIWQAILVVCLCMLVIPFVIAIPLGIVAAMMEDPNKLLVDNAVVISLVSFLAMLVVAAIVYKKTKVSVKMEKLSPITLIGSLLLTYLAGDGISRLLALLPLDDMYETYVEIMEASLSGNPVLVLITLVLVGPLVEELIFRGILYSSFRNRYGVWVSAILGGLVFAIAHGNIFQSLGTFAIGMILCLAYERFNNLTVPFLMHAFNNFIAFLEIEALWKVNMLLFVCITVIEIVFSIVLIKEMFLVKEINMEKISDDEAELN